MSTDIQRVLQSADAQAVPCQLLMMPASRFYPLLIDLHCAAIAADVRFRNAPVARLSAEDAKGAFITARDRWLGLMSILPQRHANLVVSDLLAEVENRGSLEGLLSLFLSGWNRTEAGSALRTRAQRIWMMQGGVTTPDAGLTLIPVLDSDGGGARFFDGQTLGGLVDIGSAGPTQDILNQRGSSGGPAQGMTFGELVKWGTAVSAAVVAGYVGFKTGSPVVVTATGVGIFSGFFAVTHGVGSDLEKAVDGIVDDLEAWFDEILGVGKTSVYPIDAGLTGSGNASSGSSDSDSGRSGDAGGVSDSAEDGDDGGEGEDGGAGTCEERGTPTGDAGTSGDSGLRPTDDGGSDDGGSTAADYLRRPAATFDLSQWRSLAGFGGSTAPGHPGTPGGYGLAGLLTPNPETGTDGDLPLRIAATANVDTEREVRMPGPGGIRPLSAAFAAMADFSPLITVEASGVRWRPSAQRG